MESLFEKKARTVVIAFFIIAAGALVAWKQSARHSDEGRQVSVMIQGHVKRPGMYHVPYGTTAFEVLRVAGVMPNSDLNNVNVNEAVSEGDNVNVGILEKNVTLKGGSPAFMGGPCLINFVTGKVSVVSKQGGPKAAVRNSPLAEGDRILCAADGMMEMRLGDGTLVDLKNNSELEIKSLYTADSAGLLNVTLHLAAGKLWSFIKSQPPNVTFRFTTPHLMAEIRGTEIELSADQNQSNISVIKGTVYVGRTNETDRTNLAEGQKATVFASADRTIETASMSDGEKGGDKDLQAFSKQRDTYLAQNSIRRFMFLGQPDFYCVFEIDPGLRKINIYRIPPNTPVGDYVEGVNELSKVYLYGGVGLTTSLVERILEKPIEHYAIIDRPDVVNIIENIGGVYLDVDDASASAIGVKAGFQKLDGNMVLKYLSPSRDNREKAESRQNRVVYGVFDAMTKRRLVMSSVMFTKIFMDMETDVTVDYAMSLYNTFTATTDWKIDFIYFGGAAGPISAPAKTVPKADPANIPKQ